MKRFQISTLQLKMLAIDCISRSKFGLKLTAKNGILIPFKIAVGLPKNASSEEVLRAIGEIYENNGIKHEFNELLEKYKFTLE